MTFKCSRIVIQKPILFFNKVVWTIQLLNFHSHPTIKAYLVSERKVKNFLIFKRLHLWDLFINTNFKINIFLYYSRIYTHRHMTVRGTVTEWEYERNYFICTAHKAFMPERP